eukprot:1064145-Pleurochrysis_carterae.AAC.2
MDSGTNGEGCEHAEGRGHRAWAIAIVLGSRMQIEVNFPMEYFLRRLACAKAKTGLCVCTYSISIPSTVCVGDTSTVQPPLRPWRHERAARQR